MQATMSHAPYGCNPQQHAHRGSKALPSWAGWGGLAPTPNGATISSSGLALAGSSVALASAVLGTTGARLLVANTAYTGRAGVAVSLGEAWGLLVPAGRVGSVSSRPSRSPSSSNSQSSSSLP